MFIRYRKGLSELKTTIIGIAGGTGSGKSTFTNRLKAHFGDRVTVIYHDDYYRAHDEIPFEQRQYINYDHPDSLETDLLVEHLKALRAGKSIECPVYDFTRHTAVPTLSNTNAFNNISADCEIRVPAALADEWKAATNWSTYASYIVGV